MGKLDEKWINNFQGSFETKEDVVEFIFEHLDTSHFEDSYIDLAGYHEPNEFAKITSSDKREMLYDFMMELAR